MSSKFQHSIVGRASSRSTSSWVLCVQSIARKLPLVSTARHTHRQRIRIAERVRKERVLLREPTIQVYSTTMAPVACLLRGPSTSFIVQRHATRMKNPLCKNKRQVRASNRHRPTMCSATVSVCFSQVAEPELQFVNVSIITGVKRLALWRGQLSNAKRQQPAKPRPPVHNQRRPFKR
jgi:hypothetical protein